MNWIGVDLDGTLIISDEQTLTDPYYFGEPIPAMVELIEKHIAKGDDVRIFSARALSRDYRIHKAIEQLCIEMFGKPLPIQAYKDRELKYFYDDKAISVIKNTGVVKG